MELDWIETFLAVVDRGGFTAASSQVHRSQSRVSAHIAALERELGVQLIDRTRRPATLTESGRIFAQHARTIIETVGSARSAIGVLRSMHEESLAVLTTPCIGVSLFPGVICEVLGRHPRARVALAEHGWLDDRRKSDEEFVLAVLPTLNRPHPRGLREQVLWRESIRVVLPAGHLLAQRAAADGKVITTDQLIGMHLVVGGAFSSGQSDVLDVLTAGGLDLAPRTTVDSAGTLVAMVRRGVGIGLLNAVAFESVDTTGVVAFDLDEPELVREVAMYWYDVVQVTEVGRALHDAVLQAPLPAGAVQVGAGRPVSAAAGGIVRSLNLDRSRAGRR